MSKWTARFSIKRKTGEVKLPASEETLYERVYVTLRGSSDDDLAYIVRLLKTIDGKEWE